MTDEGSPSRAASGAAELRYLTFLSLIVAMLAGIRLGGVVADQLQAPFDLIYESPNLKTIQTIQAGKNIYDPALFADVPFVMTIYTPLYHYLVAVLPESSSNPFLTGRLVTLCFMILAGLTLFLVPPIRRLPSVAVLAMSCFFLIWRVTSNAAFLKNDSMALFFSGLAAVTAAHAGDRAWKAIAAAILCWLALASKQSYLAVTLACLLFFWLNNRRLALIFTLTFASLAVTSLVGALLYFGDGVWFSLVGSVQQPLQWEPFASNWRMMLRQPLFVGLLVLFLTAACWHLKMQPGEWRRSPFPPYFVLSLAILFATLGKLGSSTNYFFEPVLAGLLLVVSALKKMPDVSLAKPGIQLGFLLTGFLALGELMWSSPTDYSFAPAEVSEERLQLRQSLNKQIAALAGANPKILNLHAAALTAELPGQVSVNDPYLYFLLWDFDRLPAKTMVDAVANHHFDVVVFPPGFAPDPQAASGQAMAKIYQALATHYRFSSEVADSALWVPRAARKSSAVNR